VAVTAVLILAFLAFNAVQAFFHRELGISPFHPQCTFGDVCRDLLISTGMLGRKRAVPDVDGAGPGWPAGPDP